MYTIIIPPFGISTPAVYRAWDEMGGPRGDNGNDLEPAAIRVEPRLAMCRQEITARAGATPRLAGGGPTGFLAVTCDERDPLLPGPTPRVVRPVWSAAPAP